MCQLCLELRRLLLEVEVLQLDLDVLWGVMAERDEFLGHIPLTRTAQSRETALPWCVLKLCCYALQVNLPIAFSQSEQNVLK